MADNKLAAVIEDLEAVPEAAQSFYEARDDGKFVLAVEGSLPNTVDKSRLDEFRDRNIEQAKELEETQKSLQEVTERYDGVDVSSYKKWAKEREDVERKKLIEAGEVEKLITQEVKKATSPLNDLLTEIKTENDALKGDLTRKNLDEAILKAASGASVQPGAESFLVDQAKREGWTTSEGRAVQIDQGGAPVFSVQNAGSHKSIPEWVDEKAREFAWAFAPSSGGGATGSDTSGPREVSKSIDRDDRNAFGANLEDIASGKLRVTSPQQ